MTEQRCTTKQPIGQHSMNCRQTEGRHHFGRTVVKFSRWVFLGDNTGLVPICDPPQHWESGVVEKQDWSVDKTIVHSRKRTFKQKSRRAWTCLSDKAGRVSALHRWLRSCRMRFTVFRLVRRATTVLSQRVPVRHRCCVNNPPSKYCCF